MLTLKKEKKKKKEKERLQWWTIQNVIERLQRNYKGKYSDKSDSHKSVIPEIILSKQLLLVWQCVRNIILRLLFMPVHF